MNVFDDGMEERTDGTLTTAKDIVPVSVINRCIL